MAVSEDHAAVLKRFREVASTEYPFELPETQKIPRSQGVNLTSFANLKPVLWSGIMLLWAMTRHVLFIFCILLALVTSGWWSCVFCILAGVHFVGLMSDVFFLHFVTDGLAASLGGRDAREGIFCKASSRNNRISERLRRFVTYRPPPYLCSGNLLTIAPYLMFKGSVGGRVKYERWWVKVPAARAPDGPDGPSKKAGGDDDEAVALDVAFPAGGHRADRPAFLVLHGLNGGSTEPYVLDLVRRATREGSTVAVMIARGLMKTPVRGFESFTGARSSDVASCVDAMLHALGGESRTSAEPKKTRLVLVGFSMGGIVASNYTAKAKDSSGLAGTVSFSGTLCSEKMLLQNNATAASLSLWQPVLAWGLKATIVRPQQAKLFTRGLSAKIVESIRTVVDIDTTLVCKYHGYADVRDYYEDMSAAGRGDDAGITRLAGARVPLLAVHAIDDPIAVFEVTVPNKIATTDNVILLATKHGGHIGWPTGWAPSKNRWNFMIDIAMEFASAVEDAKVSK